MSSELFMFDNSFFSDPFSPFTDSTIEILQENKHPNDESACLDQIASVLLSSSPPRIQLESLSLSQLAAADYSVKTEESQLSFSGFGNSLSFDGAHETAAIKLMQRSFSSNSFENNKQSFSFRPQFDAVLESQNQILTSPQNNFGQIRRVCSTGDLQKMKMQTRNVLSSSPLSTDKSVTEEAANFKVGRYSAEERKERIYRYRAKRTQRNFNKTIKYACRKTLADTRPRIRGRFARNDEAGEIPKASASQSQRYEDEDDVWMDGFHEEKDEGIVARGRYFNMSGSTQYHNFSY